MHLVDTTLFFSPTSGGVRRYLTEKHAWLRAHTAWRHSMLVPGERDHLDPGGLCTVGGAPLPGSFNYRLPLNPRRWTALLDALEPDLVEAGDAFHPAWCAARVASRRGIPFVAFYHSNMPQIIARRIGSASERALGRYARWLYERCDAVFAPSRLMCNYLERLGLRNVVHQPLGVDATVFHPSCRTATLRERLGLPPETRLLVFAGRFAGEKNVPVLMAAFEKLGPPYHLLLVGGGRSERRGRNVTMIPYRRDRAEVAECLASCDALVHAGTKETFGLVVLEAMACARPVVAVRAGAIPEFVDESVGVLAEPDDADSFAAAVAALYERDVDALGAAARSRVMQRYTWSHAFRAQLAAYAEILQQREAAIAPGAASVPAVAPLRTPVR